MSQILDLLRPGDVLTHAYSGAPNIAGAFTNIVQDGKLLPAALAAKQRGVIFDVGHGGGSFDFTVAEIAIPGGCAPDTISSDIHVFSGNSPSIPYLPNVMSKFMLLGYSLEQVVTMATTAPARIINRAPKIGTLQVGAPGDVAIMELVEGPVSIRGEVALSVAIRERLPTGHRRLHLPVSCLPMHWIGRPMPACGRCHRL